MNKASSFHYAIFDMDGLMFDTERLRIHAFQTHVAPLAQCTFSKKNLINMLGLDDHSCEQVFTSSFNTSMSFSECCTIADQWITSYINTHGIPIKPGLLDLLSWLQQNDYRLAVATSSATQLALSYLNLAGIHSYFDVVVGGDQVTTGKPHPQIFEAAARALGCHDHRECVVFEDSENGLLAAYHAGMPAIIVPDLIDPTVGRDGMYLAKASTLADAIPFLNKSP